MDDLLIAASLMAAVSIALGALAWRLAGRLGRGGRTVAAVLACAGVLASALWLRDAAWLVPLLPAAGLPVAGNLLPPALAVFAGCLLRAAHLPGWRRALVTAVPSGLAVALLAEPWSGASPASAGRWEHGVCLQSHPTSCSAAAAATLLAAHGLPGDEGDLAQRCLTRPGGTSLHGLVRGLWSAGRAHGRQPVVMSGLSADALIPHLPAILLVRLDAAVQAREPRYADAWGWTVGRDHAVVCFGVLPDGSLDIGDPGSRRERWPRSALGDLWRGTAVALR